MSLESYYDELISIYNQLRIANENFLINNTGQEGFEELVNQRSIYFDDIEIIKSSIIQHLKTLNVDFDYYSMEITDIINELPNHFDYLLPYKNKVIEALQKLIESENNVTENMTNLRNDIKQELSHTRNSKKTLNAYKPVTGYVGSHFIDKQK